MCRAWMSEHFSMVLFEIPFIVDDFQTINLLVQIRFHAKNMSKIEYAFLLLLGIYKTSEIHTAYL